MAAVSVVKSPCMTFASFRHAATSRQPCLSHVSIMRLIHHREKINCIRNVEFNKHSDKSHEDLLEIFAPSPRLIVYLLSYSYGLVPSFLQLFLARLHTHTIAWECLDDLFPPNSVIHLINPCCLDSELLTFVRFSINFLRTFLCLDDEAILISWLSFLREAVFGVICR